MLIVLLCVSFLLLNHQTNPLKISFSPSETLTKFSLYSEDLKMVPFLLKMFRDKEFWPVLAELSQARYYNFEEILSEFMSRYISCLELLNILSDPEFPVKKLLSGTVLVKNSWCLSNLTSEVIQRAQNPLDNVNFDASKWIFEHNSIFVRSLDPPPLKHKWTNVCGDWDLFDRFLEAEDEIADLILDSVSLGCFKKLSVSSTLKLLDKLDEQLRNLCTNTNVTKPRSIWPFSYFSTTKPEECVLTCTNFIVVKRVITILSLTMRNVYSTEIDIRGRRILRYFLDCSDRRLKNLIDSFLNTSIYNNNRKNKIVYLLFEILEMYCNEHFSNGTWLLNLLVVYKYFAGTGPEIYSPFFDRFLEVFFDASMTNLMTSNVASLLKFLPSQADVIYQALFERRPDLIEPFIEDYNIPADLKMTHVPVEILLSRAFKSCRKIDLTQYKFIIIDNNERDWISLIRSVSLKLISRTNRSKLLPLNFQVNINLSTFSVHHLLNLFFSSILESITTSDWWKLTGQSSDNRPIIIPSLLLPPQVMEAVGHFLASALNANMRIPFIIDWNYFSFTHKKNLRKLYPKLAEEFMASPQISRIIKLDETVTLKEIFYSSFPNSFWLSGFHECSGRDCEQCDVNYSEIDLKKLVIASSSLLRSSIIDALKMDSINHKVIHSLLFK